MRAHSGRHLQNHCPSPADHNNETATADANLTSNLLQVIPHKKKTRPIHFAGRNGIPTATVFLRQSQQISIICVSEKRKGPFNLSLSAGSLGHLPKRLQIQIKLPQNECSSLAICHSRHFNSVPSCKRGRRKPIFNFIVPC